VVVQGLDLASVKQIAAGSSFSLALLDDGTVMAWGENQSGELGNGSTNNSLVPIPVPGLTDVTAIAAGEADGYALLSNGKVMAWGWNPLGELGVGFESPPNNHGNVTVPTLVPRLTGVQDIAAGALHVVVLLDDGQVEAWGDNTNGQVGIGLHAMTVDRPTRVAVHGVSEIAAGGTSSYALLKNGNVMAWGNGAQLGNGRTYTGTKDDRYSPAMVQGLTGLNVSSVAAGDGETLALLANGNVMAWGPNTYGQLGTGTTVWADMPTTVTGLSDIVALAAGDDHSLALSADGSVWAWGINSNGQLGDNSETESKAPVKVSGLSGVTEISVGDEYSLAW